MSPQRPQRIHDDPPGGGTDRGIVGCLHEGLRIHIQVTTDLAFQYCPHCEVRGWWSRAGGIRFGKPQRA